MERRKELRHQVRNRKITVLFHFSHSDRITVLIATGCIHSNDNVVILLLS